MRDEVSRFSFRARITREGAIIVPTDVAARFPGGRTVLVSVTPAPTAGRGIDIDDDEVAQIAALQAEPADVIRRCLRAQGALAGKARNAVRKQPRGTGKR
ncbi:MAG TPA: hypothetical protein VI932_08165 [Bacteroidota bacterium]|nr:hypothetical protein [Bacteroidota bacterium]